MRVEHVEPSGLSDSPQIGDTLQLRAFVDLGGLTPDDVEVQLVHGHVSDTDDLRDMEVATLEVAENNEGGRYQFAGAQSLRRTGSFGYSVRVVPKNAALAGPAEMGLARNA